MPTSDKNDEYHSLILQILKKGPRTKNELYRMITGSDGAAPKTWDHRLDYLRAGGLIRFNRATLLWERTDGKTKDQADSA